MFAESLEKPNQHLSIIPHNWTPMYAPPAPSLSPKLYNLVRNMRLASVDRGPVKQRERLENVVEEESRVQVRGLDVRIVFCRLSLDFRHGRESKGFDVRTRAE